MDMHADVSRHIHGAIVLHDYMRLGLGLKISSGSMVGSGSAAFLVV